jgi:outer membrane lipoprotein-sorting protein
MANFSAKSATVWPIAVGFASALNQLLMASAIYGTEPASHTDSELRSIHVRVERSSDDVSETWAEFDEEGKLLRMRMNSPKTEDGEKEAVWHDGRAEVWFKTKGHVLVLHDPDTAKKIERELAEFDPQSRKHKLYQAQSNGKVKIEPQAASKQGEPITLVVSFTGSPEKREVYLLDPKTQIVRQLKSYRQVDGKHKLTETVDFLEYNQKIPPSTFVLNVPANVPRIDWTKQEVGLPQGELTKDQIAVKVAREFFAALIAKDYERAGSILSGMPASQVKERLGKIEFLRIISVGDPTPHPDTRTRFVQVPCEVEFRVEGEIHTKKFMPNIRPVEGQPDRWLIGGGI